MKCTIKVHAVFSLNVNSIWFHDTSCFAKIVLVENFRKIRECWRECLLKTLSKNQRKDASEKSCDQIKEPSRVVIEEYLCDLYITFYFFQFVCSNLRYSYARYLERFNFCGFWSFFARITNKREDEYQFSFFLRSRAFYEFLKTEAGKEVFLKQDCFYYFIYLAVISFIQ